MSSSIASGVPAGSSVIPTMTAQFREIHKNTWLKRLTAEGKKVVVGPKKSDRSWVVFCVHDDTEAVLEGYAEPRNAPSHNPEWVVGLQDTLHISHALIPNSHEFEFVVTLTSSVIRFHAMSWDIMQEWVDTLRSKLREMKILSPRENLYTKLPEVRLPLLPTRDPTSPLPAPPPVPAAIVPGVERVMPSVQQQILANANENNASNESQRISDHISSLEVTTPSNTSTNVLSNTMSTVPSISTTNTTPITNTIQSSTLPLTSMSNTLSQNLLNMLSDPISTYSEQVNDSNSSSSSVELESLPNAVATFSLALKEDEEFAGPLLRKPSVKASDKNIVAINNNSVRLDILAAHRASADQVRNLENILQCDPHIPRPHTSRSLSAGAVDKSNKLPTNDRQRNNIVTADTSLPIMIPNTSSKGNNITELEIHSKSEIKSTTATPPSSDTKSNITIIQVSNDIVNSDKTSANDSDYENPKLQKKSINAEIFTFPDALSTASTPTKQTSIQHEYKSNVQIIPSSSKNNSSSHHHHNGSSTIQVLGSNLPTQPKSVSNQYSTPVKKIMTVAASIADSITTVHVAGTDHTYGTCFSQHPVTSSPSASRSSTPKLPKKVILSANTSGITNIAVNDTDKDISLPSRKPLGQTNALHYEKVFLSSTSTASAMPSSPASCNITATSEVNSGPSSSSSSQQHGIPPISPKWSSPHRHSQFKSKMDLGLLSPSKKSSSNGFNKEQNGTPSVELQENSLHSLSRLTQGSTTEQLLPSTRLGSPAIQRRRVASPSGAQATGQISRSPFLLTRGLTEAVITSRPSRRDFHFLGKLSSSKPKSTQPASGCGNLNNKTSVTNSNNNGEIGHNVVTQTPTHMSISRTTSDAIEQRRRSSSTSDAQAQRQSRGANNNEFSNRANASVALRQPPHVLGGGGPSAVHNMTASPAKRMTLREQQVIQLRREIMHPGGVRLQLRRKDCLGSAIAFVESFGAVWVAGWKQKEHPVLYNALHIGDQLLSIAGVTISSATEANKIIRSTNTLFVEVLVRRIPFGRGYAIRREREGQCLGLIRDGNSATIVDVVPNSLAARHGLPPKAQSCDGTTLTFWVLTEINGRPLNLFFKDNEIRDRLNSVGRDISILVQPSDLIVKLKKQLKSIRGYKDYLVQ